MIPVHVQYLIKVTTLKTFTKNLKLFFFPALSYNGAKVSWIEKWLNLISIVVCAIYMYHCKAKFADQAKRSLLKMNLECLLQTSLH